jgi:hypothetical protein
MWAQRVISLLLFDACRCSLYNNPQAKEYVEALLTRAARPMCTLFQITGHNRARQRDKWAHMLDDLSNLQEEVAL